MKAKSKTSITSFNRTRVIKLTTINFLLMLSVELFTFIHFEGIFNLYSKGNVNLIFTMIYITTLSVSFFGAGIYITSIVTEAFTLPRLRKAIEFKTQDIAEHLFHGVLSHTLIYCGWIFNFLILSIFELVQGIQTTNIGFILIASGLVLGVAFAISQIQIDTYLYPFFGSVVSLTVLCVFLVLSKQNIAEFLLPSFIFGFLISSTSVNFVYFGLLWKEKRAIHFDRVKF